VQQLLRAGANPNQSTDSGLVPLHFAAISSLFPDLAADLDVDLVQDPSAVSDDYVDHDAAQQFDADATVDGLYSFMQASSTGNTLYKMQQLLQKPDKARWAGGCLAVVKLLLAAGANANGSTAAGPVPAGAFVFGSSSSSSSSRLITPLHLAACCVVPGDTNLGADAAAAEIVAAAAEAVGWDTAAAAAAGREDAAAGAEAAAASEERVTSLAFSHLNINTGESARDAGELE
jgi:hypothetical protein